MINKIHFFWFLLTKLDFLQTIRFNFKMLPFKQAIRLPFYFYGKVKFGDLSGTLILNEKNIYPGKYRFGENEEFYPHGNHNSYMYLKGKLILENDFKIGNNYSIFISKNAELRLSHKVFIGQNVKIVCFNNIQIGEGSRIGWESQLIDSNFHYTENLNTQKINQRHGEIAIGKYNWIGNRSTIMKGSYTPDFISVTSNSLLNKNYTNLNQNTLIGGMPAKIITENFKRIFDVDQENQWIDKFNEPW